MIMILNTPKNKFNTPISKKLIITWQILIKINMFIQVIMYL